MGAWYSNEMKEQLAAKKLRQVIHIAKSELGLDDDTYRAMLAGLGVPDSTTKMSLAQLKRVLNHMKRSGFKVRAKPKDLPQDDHPQSKMLRGLWLELHQLGYVSNPSEAALTAWVKRETQVHALQWLTIEQAQAVIEKLKQWRWRDERRLQSEATRLHVLGRLQTADLAHLAHQWCGALQITKTVAAQMSRRLKELAQ